MQGEVCHQMTDWIALISAATEFSYQGVDVKHVIDFDLTETKTSLTWPKANILYLTMTYMDTNSLRQVGYAFIYFTKAFLLFK